MNSNRFAPVLINFIYSDFQQFAKRFIDHGNRSAPVIFYDMAHP